MGQPTTHERTEGYELRLERVLDASRWIPSRQPAVVPFMVTIVEMSDEGRKTRYIVRALHWTEAARKQHQEMGFHKGWEQTTGQLEALARTL